MKDGEVDCTSKFNPKKWDKKKVTWKGKLFIKDTAFSLFHIPLNLEGVVKKSVKKLEEANALPKEVMILVDEKSMFHANVYVSSKKAIIGIQDVKLSGTFLTRVFEGPYKNMKTWIKEMKEYVNIEGQELKHLYFYYVTCQASEKDTEKNYVVLFAEI